MKILITQSILYFYHMRGDGVLVGYTTILEHSGSGRGYGRVWGYGNVIGGLIYRKYKLNGLHAKLDK